MNTEYVVMVELQLVMYIIHIFMLKLVGVMDKWQVVMYTLRVVMRKKKSLPTYMYFMPFFIDCKLLYPYCNSFLTKKLVVAHLGVPYKLLVFGKFLYVSCLVI